MSCSLNRLVLKCLKIKDFFNIYVSSSICLFHTTTSMVDRVIGSPITIFCMQKVLSYLLISFYGMISTITATILTNLSYVSFWMLRILVNVLWGLGIRSRSSNFIIWVYLLKIRVRLDIIPRLFVKFYYLIIPLEIL